MRQQEIFNQAVNHLLTQGEKSMFEGEVCAYRSEEGLKCAVGIFIPDDKYYPTLEGNCVGEPCVKNVLPFRCTEGIVDLLSRLQAIHDDHEPEEWKEELLCLAEDQGLNMPGVGK